MRALLLAHDSAVCQRVVAWLTRRGHDIAVETSIETLSPMLNDQTFDLFLVDPRYADIDPASVCAALRARPNGDVAVAIALVDSSDVDFDQTIEAGFDDVWSRGATPDEITAGLMVAERRVEQRQARAKREQALLVERDLLQSLVDNVPDLLYAKDRELRFVCANSAVARHLGVSEPLDVIGRTDADFFPEALARAFAADERRIIDDGAALIDQLEGVTGDDASPRWVMTSKAPLRNRDGAVIGLVGAARDATARVQAERALVQSERRFRSLVQHAADVITVIDPNGLITYQSPASHQVMGDSPDDWIGASIYDGIDDNDAARLRAALAALAEEHGGVRTIEVRRQGGDGGWRTLAMTATNLLANDVGGIVLNTRNLTDQRAAESRLRAAEARYRSLVEQIPAISYSSELVAGKDVFTYISPQVESILGYQVNEFLTLWNAPAAMDQLVHPDDHAQFTAELERSNTTATPYRCEYRHRTKSGGYVWLLSEAAMLPAEGGLPPIWHGVMFDLSAQKAAEARYRTLVEQIPAVTYITTVVDGVETFRYVSPQVESRFGYRPDEFLALANPDWLLVIHPDDRARVVAMQQATQATKTPFLVEYRLRVKSGAYVWVRDEATILPDDGSGLQQWQGVLLDLSEHKAMAALLEHQAFHDTLTALPNRALLTERLEQALARAHRHGASTAVLFLDLDNFKIVNDSLGHEAGDALLIAAGRRLSATVRTEDTVARLGGDEFTILMEEIADPAEAMRVARRIVRAFADPFDIAGRSVYATTSIGIAIGRHGSSKPRELLRDADVAMYQAKRAGKGEIRLFDPAINDAVSRRLTLEQALRGAVEREEFEVYYQPVVAVETGAPRAVEALVRWRHPDHGSLGAMDFVPLAEEIGVILPIGRWVLGEACRQAAIWQADLDLDPPLAVSVNLSVRQFHHPELVADVARALAAAGLDPARLQMEITESVFVDELESALATLGQLRRLGVTLALDDFGTGYSSLSHLKQLPVDLVKIDRSFISGLGRDPRDAPIVSSIAELGRTLGMAVAAEGVETAEQVRFLQAAGIALAQGYFFAPPLPAGEAGEALARLAAAPIRLGEACVPRRELSLVG